MGGKNVGEVKWLMSIAIAEVYAAAIDFVQKFIAPLT